MATVIVKVSGESIDGQDRTLGCKNLVYEQFKIAKDDPILSDLVEDAKAQFNGPIESVDLTIKYNWE